MLATLTHDEATEEIGRLRARVAELEAEVARLKVPPLAVIASMRDIERVRDGIRDKYGLEVNERYVNDLVGFISELS